MWQRNSIVSTSSCIVLLVVIWMSGAASGSGSGNASRSGVYPTRRQLDGTVSGGVKCGGCPACLDPCAQSPPPPPPTPSPPPPSPPPPSPPPPPVLPSCPPPPPAPPKPPVLCPPPPPGLIYIIGPPGNLYPIDNSSGVRGFIIGCTWVGSLLGYAGLLLLWGMLLMV